MGIIKNPVVYSSLADERLRLSVPRVGELYPSKHSSQQVWFVNRCSKEKLRLSKALMPSESVRLSRTVTLKDEPLSGRALLKRMMSDELSE